MSSWTLLLVPLVAATFACASWRAEPTGCPALAAAKAKPARFQERADAAVEARDLETAYRCLALIETLYPGSPESDEAYPLAAVLLKRLYWRDRYQQPPTLWVTAEPEFMFGWLSRYFADEFPKQQADRLFVGMPNSFFRAFESFARTNPQVQRWTIRVEDDNGLIQSVDATSAGS